MKNIKFSIVTVCFNSEKTIERTFQSILNQNYKNFEYIVIDGVSKDKTLSIVESYKRKFAELDIDFRVVSEADDGIYDAMNKGISLSGGEYVGLLNSDDWYELEALATINSTINESEFKDIYHGDLIQHESIGSRLIKAKPSTIKMDYMGMCHNHPTFFVKKVVYDKLLYDCKYKILADFKFVCEALIQKFEFYEYGYAIVNMQAGGASDVNHAKRITEGYRARRDIGFSVTKATVSTVVRVLVTFAVIIKGKLTGQS